MKLLEELHHPEKYFQILLKWGVLGLLMGLLGGWLGAAFHHALHFVTHVRGEAPWLIFLLPVGGLLTVGLYQLLFKGKNRGTNEIIDAVLNGQPVNPLIAPAIFAATGITHLFGGSAGREGAALQIGGSVASLLGRLLKLRDNERTVLVMSGLAAVFAGLFGTPLTATLFTMEFASVGTIFSPALLPCFLAALMASQVSAALGVHAETAFLSLTLDITAVNSLKLLALAVAVGLLGVAMCFIFHKAEHLAKDKVKNPWIRIAVGGMIIVILTLLVGDHRPVVRGNQLHGSACKVRGGGQNITVFCRDNCLLCRNVIDGYIVNGIFNFPLVHTETGGGVGLWVKVAQQNLQSQSG